MRPISKKFIRKHFEENTLLYVREDHVVAEFKQLILMGGLTLLSIEDVYQAQEYPA